MRRPDELARMRALTLIFVVASVSHAAPALADPAPSYEPLTTEQMNKLLPGQTIKGEYRVLRQRSRTFNFKESHHEDGTTHYQEGPISENGLWYTLGDHKICYKYPKNPAMQTSCFWVYKSGTAEDSCYYGYGLYSMSLNGPRDYNDWTARWIVEGSGGSCDTPVS